MKHKHVTVNHFTLCFFLTLLLCVSFRSSLADQSWRLEVDKTGIQVFTKKVPDSQLKAFKAQMTLNDVDLSTVERLFKNYDQIPTWLDRAIEAKMLHKVDADSAVLYVAMDMPWPVKNRDVVAMNRIFMSDNGQELQCTTTHIISPEHNIEIQNRVRVEKLNSKMTFSRINDSEVFVTMEGHADPSGRVPNWLANLMVTESPFNSLMNLRAILLGKTIGQ